MISSSWGHFALVSYVPEPLGSCLDGLTQALPGSEFRQAHITILPPRPLTVPVEEASRYIRRVLEEFSSFEVTLDEVRRFPATNVLYLDLSIGNESVHRIHDALNTGVLAFNEPFEFHPHLTLAGPIPPEEVDSIETRAAGLWKNMDARDRFTVSEIVALWAETDPRVTSWQRLWAHPLRTDQTRRASGIGRH